MGGRLRYTVGVNFTIDMLNSIPIPENVDENGIVDNVDRIIDAQVMILALTSDVYAAIRASGSPKKLRRQFDQWYELSNAEFIEQLSRQGIDLSIRDKIEWIKILDQNKIDAAQSVALVSTAEKVINDIVFDAFGLDQYEREHMNA